jgi:OmpA-OmpF porin, OOP family
MKKIAVALLFALAAPAASAEFTAWVCGAGVPGVRQAGVDDDVDSIPDSDDWCPDTPAGTRVGANGCADWEVPVRCERKGADAAPAAGAAAPAVASAPAAGPAAAAADTDGDGVMDSADQCAATPRGMPVDARGCVQIEKVVLEGVSFELGSSKLLPAAEPTLRTVASAMKASPQVAVEIGGHTDSIGPPDKNQRLSQRRAESVRKFLEGEGIEASRLVAKGYGESQPLQSNETTEGRARNRRVEFKLLKP